MHAMYIMWPEQVTGPWKLSGLRAVVSLHYKERDLESL